MSEEKSAKAILQARETQNVFAARIKSRETALAKDLAELKDALQAAEGELRLLCGVERISGIALNPVLQKSIMSYEKQIIDARKTSESLEKRVKSLERKVKSLEQIRMEHESIHQDLAQRIETLEQRIK